MTRKTIKIRPGREVDVTPTVCVMSGRAVVEIYYGFSELAVSPVEAERLAKALLWAAAAARKKV